MKKQTPWEEIVLRTKEHTQCTCTQLSVFCENPGSLVKTRHRCSELWGSLVFWASPSFKCLFSGLISLSHLCINGECVSVCPGLQWGILDSAVLGACTLDGCELNICADCCQVSSSSGYIRKRSLCRSILLAGDCSVFRCSEGPAGCSHRCCGSGVLWGWVRSLVWGAEHCPPQRGAALVTWLWPHSCPRSCHSNHWHVSGVCTAQPGCFPSSAWIVQAGKDPPLSLSRGISCCHWWKLCKNLSVVLGVLNLFFPLFLFCTAPNWACLWFILFPVFVLLQQQCECQLAITIFGVIWDHTGQQKSVPDTVKGE